MKIFTKKSILQKTILVILTVLCINFITPTYSHADFGGVLASPFIDFFCSIGDVIINALQRIMMGEWGSEDATNMSLSAFLATSSDYYNADNGFYKEGNASKAESINPDKEFDKGWLNIKDEYYVPIATYSPEQIFSGSVPGLDINFINPKYDDGSAADLQGTISSWYMALRNLAIVGLLCVLVYVGIRMVLSSTGKDKAKYKQMFMDWLIALCLLFFLHYIMSFTLTLVDAIVEAIGGDGTYTVSVTDETAGKTFSTNLLGLVRFKTQYADFGQKFTYFLFYMALVAYTVVFTWHYLKRLLMMAFLTIIAPMVALTYPIDKIGDGKAQAFNMWIKEYIYNALVQPFHLIIYTVFVGSSIELAQTNILYALACMGFILPAEKFLKKMFGFDKAPLGTMGALTGFTMGSLASQLGKTKSSGGGKATGERTESSKENKTLKYERHHGTEGIDLDNNPKLNTSNDNKKEENEEEEKTEATAERAKQAFAEEEKARQLAEQQNEINQQQRELENNMEDLDNNKDRGKEINEEKDKKQGLREVAKQGLRNVVSAHGGKRRLALKGAKTIGKGAKFIARTGLTLGGMAAGAGMGLASGQGLAGVAAGATAGKAIGSRMGNAIANAPENIAHKVTGTYRGVANFANETIDTFNGNTDRQDRAQAKAFMKSAETDQYIRDKWTTNHNGKAPTAKQLKEEKDKIQIYADEGMTDIAQIYRARKAEKFGVDAEQSAKIALLAQDRKITSEVLGDEKKYNSRKEDFKQEFMDKGLTEEKATERADYVLNVMKAQVGQRHNLGKQSKKTTATQESKAPTQTRKPRQKPNPNPNPTPLQNPKPTPTQKPNSTPKNIRKEKTASKKGRKGRK